VLGFPTRMQGLLAMGGGMMSKPPVLGSVCDGTAGFLGIRIDIFGDGNHTRTGVLNSRRFLPPRLVARSALICPLVAHPSQEEEAETRYLQEPTIDEQIDGHPHPPQN
jgi:hypothetical protein